MRCALVLCLLLLTPCVADAAQLKVCASGCAYTNAQLQNALNAAVDGDEVLLESGHTYTAEYILGDRCVTPRWDCIIVRTGVTSTGTVMNASSFPADGHRIDTSYRGVLAKLVPANNQEAAIRTVYPGENTFAGCTSGNVTTTPCRGNGWTLKWLE